MGAHRRPHRLGRRPHLDVLTPAEWRVLEGIREGLPNAAIAARLGVSVNTVRYHVSNMLAKLDLPDRVALAAWDGAPATGLSPGTAEAPRRRGRLALPFLGWVTSKPAGVAIATGALVALGALALLVLPAALADDPQPAAAVTGQREPGVYETLLALAPYEAAPRAEPFGGVMMGDLARLRQATEVGLPEAEEHPTEYLARLRGASEARGIPFTVPDFLGLQPIYWQDILPNVEASLGVSIADVDAWLRPAPHIPFEAGVVRGRFDVERSASRLATCSDCPPPDIRTHLGQEYWAWGPDWHWGDSMDPSTRLTPPAYDELGRGGRIAVQPEHVIRTLADERMEAILDAQAGLGSLAAHEDFRLAAAHLDRLGTLTAYLTARTQSPERAAELAEVDPDGEMTAAGAWRAAPGDAVLEPYAVIALGDGLDDGGAYTAVLLVHGDATTAQANAALVEARVEAVRDAFGDELPERNFRAAPESIEVTVKGRVLIAILRPGGPAPVELEVIPYFLHR